MPPRQLHFVQVWVDMRREDLLTAHVFVDTVGWKNNADLDPEILYPNSQLVQ